MKHKIDLSAAKNRPIAISEALKDWIVRNAKEPGSRLPQEPDLIKMFSVSKSTIREALKVLETQGLVQMRTGPGGGAFVTEISDTHAQALLANHFFFKKLTINDIYELRMALEPKLASELAGYIGENEIRELQQTMVKYDHPATTIEEEQEQRIAELEFHTKLSKYSKNPLLGFICGFLVGLLKELAVCKKIYQNPIPKLRKRGYSYQAQLLEAFSVGDAQAAHDISRAHMTAAKSLMEAQETIVNRSFLSLVNNGR